MFCVELEDLLTVLENHITNGIATYHESLTQYTLSVPIYGCHSHKDKLSVPAST